jgi:hypothetical protein
VPTTAQGDPRAPWQGTPREGAWGSGRVAGGGGRGGVMGDPLFRHVPACPITRPPIRECGFDLSFGIQCTNEKQEACCGTEMGRGALLSHGLQTDTTILVRPRANVLSVRCCDAVASFYSITASQRQTGGSQHHSAKRAPTATQRQTGRSQHHSAKRAAQTVHRSKTAVKQCHRVTASLRQTSISQHHSDKRAPTASQRQTGRTQRHSITASQHHSMTASQHRTLMCSHEKTFPLHTSTGSYSYARRNESVAGA